MINNKIKAHSIVVVHVKEDKIFNKACPASIFANNRIPKLKPLAKKEINSIINRNGIIENGTLEGRS